MGGIFKKEVNRLGCAVGRSAAVLPEWRKLKMIPCHADIRKTLLTLVIPAPTSVLPMLFPIGQAEVPTMLSENDCFADFSKGPANEQEE
jgi:hypothetical protein